MSFIARLTKYERFLQTLKSLEARGMDLQQHIEVMRNVKLFQLGWRNAIKMIWHIASEHGKEISVEDFIKAISAPTTTTTNEVQPKRE